MFISHHYFPELENTLPEDKTNVCPYIKTTKKVGGLIG